MTERTEAGLLSKILRRLTTLENRRFTLPARLGGNGRQIANWNDATSDGFYWGDSASNQPEAGLMVGLVVRTGTRVTQEVHKADISLSSSMRTWRRVLAAGTWTAWVPVTGAPMLVTTDRGLTTIPGSTWTRLNTASSGGTFSKNDGFTFGVGGITVPRPGIYDVDATVRFGSATAGDARLLRLEADDVFPDGTGYGANWGRYASGMWANQNQRRQVTGKVPINNRLNIECYQNSGANMNVVLDTLSMVWLAPL